MGTTGRDPDPTGDAVLDALIVGAGPTGLALATQLHAFGARFRLIDRLEDRGRESRALGVQARTLELLQTLGLGEALVARGSTSTRLVLHLDARTVAELRLGDFAATDTRFPFILFVSQAETEALLAEKLRSAGIEIERGVELTEAEQGGGDDVRCALRHAGGREERVRAKFLVGCDGAHSTVRRISEVPFEGGSYPQEFVLGDVEADGALVSGAINSFVDRGVAMFFPLGRPATWRVIAMAAAAGEGEGEGGRSPGADVHDLSLDELQAVVDAPTGGSVRVRDPVWLTRFRLHHRQTAHYRAGRLFLAGDAAHIHSPVGAQGMNTGIQDAWNLGWKLALVARGSADPRLLDSYEAERWPVGRFLLRYTDRAFGALTRATSRGAIAGWARRVVPRLLPRVYESRRLRAFAFRFVSELGIHYRRSPAVVEGEPRLRGGPRAGDRLPDGSLTIDGRPGWLQEAIAAAPRLALLLCGEPAAWDAGHLDELRARFDGLLAIHRLTSRAHPGALVDERGEVLARLGVRDAAQYLVRPDGHVAFRCAGRELSALESYLGEWFTARRS